MGPDDSNSPIAAIQIAAGQYFGKRLRQLRLEAGWTQEQFR